MQQTGLRTGYVSTPDGMLALRLPDDFGPGEHVTGTLAKVPNGTTEVETQTHLAHLSQYSVQIETVKVFADDTPIHFKTPLPRNAQPLQPTSAEGDTIESIATFSDPAGQPIAEVAFEMPRVAKKCPPPRTSSTTGGGPTPFTFPKTTAIDEFFLIEGQFNGLFDNTHAQVNGTDVPIIAESEHGVVIDNPTTTTGPATVSIQEGAFKQTETVQVVPPQVAQLPTHQVLAQATKPLQTTATSKELPKVSLPQPNTAVSSTPVVPEAVSSPPQSQATPTVSECETTIGNYKANLHALVDSAWHPSRPATKGEYVAHFRYGITSSGQLDHVELLQSSGSDTLDRSALQRIYELQGHFPPVPSCFQQPVLEINHTFKVIYR
jgi:TonB family protein